MKMKFFQASVGILVLLFLGGCAGLHLYNSGTHELAKKAETHFKKAEISKSLGEERKQMNDLSDDMVTKINIQYFTDARDGLIKALTD